jgi:thymidylate synthase (FAD)
MQAEYVDHMGGDVTVVNAARVSFNKHISYIHDRDVRLIRFLARNGHWTPFGHPQITMRETVPLFVARQRFKHMVGFVYNEVSRRYVDDEPEFFIPASWRKRPDSNIKQGSGETHQQSPAWHAHYNNAMQNIRHLYNCMVQAGVAPEQARMVLPQSMYTSYYVTGSLAAWARAYKLRADDHAQVEIQQLAAQWDDIVRPLFPVSWTALTEEINDDDQD